jgi:hypothetical protein
MATFTDVILLEIADQDVITCHFAYDPMPYVHYIIRTPGATDLVVVDMQGQVENLIYEFTTDSIRTEFRKRFPFYAVLHRRHKFVARADDTFTYEDSWPMDCPTYFSWFFPPHSRVRSLTLPPLAGQLVQWNNQPMLTQITTGLTLSATYQHGTDAGLALPPAGALDFDALLCDLAPPHGTEAEILCRAISAVPELATLLEGTTAIPALLAQKLDLNLNAPGTRSLVG